MNGHTRRRSPGSAERGAAASAIDGLLWGLPARLGLAAREARQERRGERSARAAGAAPLGRYTVQSFMAVAPSLS